VCKPHDQGSSIGVSIVKHLEEMIGACEALTEKYGGAFVERYCDGPEVTVAVLGTGEDVRALPLLELRPKNAFYDYEAKYTEGMTEFVIPAEVEPMTARMAQQTGIRAHQIVGCHGWSRVDMHIDGDGMPQVHEINSIPGMTPLSDVPAQAKADGMAYDDLVAEILASAFAPRP
jgi:D-alanine-D-alanine ligase